ncbi:MAG: hypothetical protein BHV98_07365 [Clostridium sp. CAG:217_53_7]|nr:MAG: hypothetical protein BHV98_07365 [Clostridium sp. CAG:217_53_7]
MQEYAVDIKHLSKVYKLYNKPSDRVLEAFGIGGKKRSKTFEALNDVSFNVKIGETVGIIGTNGAGKSTLLKIITGVLQPSMGEVKIKGKVSALLELGAGFNDEYSGIDNIYLNGRMMGYILKLIKIPLKLIFELTSNNKWYYESHLYKFNCDVKVNTDNLNEFKLQIINPTLKNNNQNIIKPYLISSPEGEVIIDNYYYELCFDELKRKLVLILSVFIFFCVPIKIFAFIVTGILLFFAVLSGLSIKKYMAIKKVVQFS